MLLFTWNERFHVISSVRVCVIPLPLYPINSVKLLYTPLMGHQAKIMHDEATRCRTKKYLWATPRVSMFTAGQIMTRMIVKQPF